MTDLKLVLSEENLTMEELFILYLLYTDVDFYNYYISKNQYKINLDQIFQTLIIKGYVSFIDHDIKYTDLGNIVFYKNFNELFDFDIEEQIKVEKTQDYNEQWNEFLSLYPKKSGIRPLHNMKDQCRLKYIKIIKQFPHEEIMKGLTTEINLREKAAIRKQWFPEWKLLSTYINQKGWEQFLELNENEDYKFEADGRITKLL